MHTRLCKKTCRILTAKIYTVLTWSNQLSFKSKGITINRPKEDVATMSDHKFFFDRRKGNDRRLDRDPCKNMPLDIYHRKRRKSTERRTEERSIADDYLAFLSDADSTGKTQH